MLYYKLTNEPIGSGELKMHRYEINEIHLYMLAYMRFIHAISFFTERKKKRTIFKLLLFLRLWWNFTNKIVSYSFLTSCRQYEI